MLWHPESWGNAPAASIGQAMIAHGKLGLTEDELFEKARKAGALDLY